MTLTIKTQDSVSSIFNAVRDALPPALYDSDSVYDCFTIIDEFHANIREHVASKESEFKWWLTLECRNGAIEMTFQYGGPCFDPTQIGTVIHQPIESRRIGGLGLTLITQLSDKIDYTYKNGLNTLCVVVKATKDSKENDPWH
ncbi:MAG: hypothetical protein CL583_07555 [Alteromonadaceae bacterium]|uniref:ATP-binding protein n=1 Tax=Marinobacter shengliensis TaxID=1389223 RepID=UPI000C0A5B07|nr:ATP-binding protein [Marinobacter shengliensis]MAL98294.1 hypothetical protein [Alteromonadaceae bacterium]BEH15239.1 ATP-binding protein [Marinobacter shengliensis]